MRLAAARGVRQGSDVAERIEVLQLPLIDSGVELGPLRRRSVLLDDLFRLGEALRLGEVLKVFELGLSAPDLLFYLVEVDDAIVLGNADHFFVIPPLLFEVGLHLQFKCGHLPRLALLRCSKFEANLRWFVLGAGVGTTCNRVRPIAINTEGRHFNLFSVKDTNK